MEKLEFPFIYRKGQKRDGCWGFTMQFHRKEQIFIQAPTGVGKTMSAVFPAVRAIGEGKAETLFYLTARTITRTVAQDAFEILRKNGLLFIRQLRSRQKRNFASATSRNAIQRNVPMRRDIMTGSTMQYMNCWTNEQSFDRETTSSTGRKMAGLSV